METGIYVRVSTEEQAQEGFSIRAQEQKLKDYVRIKDWSIHRIYVDEGISGKNITERPAMNELIADIQAGHVKNVLVFKIDRLTRSTADLIYLVDLLNDHDCAFNSLMESIDTQTASGRMFLKIIGIFAEFERENIIERVKLGVERKVKEGYCLSSHISSYGYTREAGEKIQTIVPEEAEIVRKVFDMYVNQGYSLLKISEILNTLKVPTKNNGYMWAVMTVRNILTNCNLIGNVRHHCANGTSENEWEGLHEPIISKELFDEAQELIEKRRLISKTKHPKDENYFTGILICKKCGRSLTTHNYPRTLADGSISSRRAYRCGNKILKLCDSGEVSHSKAEQAFQEYIETIEELAIPSIIQQQEQEEQKRQEQAKQIPIYQDKLKQLEARSREILNRYVDNEIEFDVYKTMTKRIENEMAIIQSELEQLTQPAPSKTAIEHKDIIRELKENWTYLTDKEKRQFLVRFVKAIVIQNEKEPGTRARGNTRIFDIEFHCE